MAEGSSPVVHMEGESSHNDPLQLMSLNSNWNVTNDVSQVPEPVENMVVAAGRNVNQTDALGLPWWTQSPQPAPSYVNFLTENTSTFLPKTPENDMVEKFSSSLSGLDAAISGASAFQGDLLYCSSLGKVSGSKSIGLPMDMDPWKLHTSWTDKFVGDSYDKIFQVDQKVMGAVPGFPSRPQSASKQKSLATDRIRRVRIAEGVAALQELLPKSVEGGQEYVLDDIIDHVKFLRLQIKDLSRSRLGAETITEPIIFREGYGHYFLHQQMLNEPLEEMMEKLLETDSMEATRLLEDKGLLMVPLGPTKKQRV